MNEHQIKFNCAKPVPPPQVRMLIWMLEECLREFSAYKSELAIEYEKEFERRTAIKKTDNKATFGPLPATRELEDKYEKARSILLIAKEELEGSRAFLFNEVSNNSISQGQTYILVRAAYSIIQGLFGTRMISFMAQNPALFELPNHFKEL